MVGILEEEMQDPIFNMVSVLNAQSLFVSKGMDYSARVAGDISLISKFLHSYSDSPSQLPLYVLSLVEKLQALETSPWRPWG